YDAGEGSWALGESGFWQTLYHFGTIPALILTIGSVVGYGASWSKQRWKPWRRVFIFILLVAVTGPGLVTNLALKENWGRPRPREVEGMGGHNAFEPVLTVDRDSEGKSFPCGHATMGYLFMGGFFLLLRYRRRWAIWILAGGFVGGTLTGIARMLQGAHFLSDVVWAAGICWFVPMGLFYALGLHRGILQSHGLFETTPKWIKATSWIVGISVFTAAMFATPFHSKRDLFIVNEEALIEPIHAEFLFELGDIDIAGSDRYHITGEAYGHGVPTSKVATIYDEREKEGFWEIWYMERISGRVTEANQQLKIGLPRERTSRVGLRTGKARIWLELFEPADKVTIRLLDGEGEVHLIGSGIPYEVIQNGENLGPNKGAKVTIEVREEFAGTLIRDTSIET
ncbi:MAG: phosphatase PAP2 family protein, partial [Verrucomicrobiota bacterium]